MAGIVEAFCDVLRVLPSNLYSEDTQIWTLCSRISSAIVVRFVAGVSEEIVRNAV